MLEQKHKNFYRLIQGDCLQVLFDLTDESIDLVVTSPPYNKAYANREDRKVISAWKSRNIAYGDYKDDLPEEEYQKWQITVLNELFRVLKPKCSVFYNHKNRIKNNEVIVPFQWISESKFTIKQMVVWDRGCSPQISPTRFLPTTEYLYHLTKGGAIKFNKQALSYGEVWKIRPVRRPATFPEELVKRCLIACSNENDIILDPFLGSGTTMKVAQDLGRSCIGIELNPEYCELAKKHCFERRFLDREVDYKSEVYGE